MRPQEAGAIATQANDAYLAHDWYRALTPSQLEAYIRYIFIALKEHAYDVDCRAQRNRRINWDGGENNYGHKHKGIWQKVAKAIKDNDAVPGIWMAAHFSQTFHAVRIAENKGFIDNRPELLCSHLSLEVYQRYMDGFEEVALERCVAAEYSVATQSALLVNVIKDPDDLSFYILSDKTNVNATPFFRHALAVDLDCQRAMNKYIAAAAMEYDLNQQLYDELMLSPKNANWTSAQLKEVVAENRKYWRRYHG
jgi:hypothetical protein